MQERVVVLYQKCLAGTADAAEKLELSQLLEEPANEARIRAAIDDLLAADKPLEDIPEETMGSMLRAIFEAAEATGPVRNKSPRSIARRVWWAAAVVLGVVATTWYVRQQYRTMPESAPVAIQATPGYNKAVLTLASGEVVLLDSAGQQQLSQGAILAQQQGGLLTYKHTGNKTEAGYNTLSTPRGGQFRVVLPDGTTVWLNAASSLRYPLAFTGKQRLVEVTGEAFFTVAPDAAKPFHVKVNGVVEVAVLGTSFNINAYTDEQYIRTTLLEGAVNVTKGATTVRLHPGQQAEASNRANGLQVATGIDPAQVVAWKNGVFDFNRMPLDVVMRQLARWYDIEVAYEKNIPDITFWGKMGRDLPLSDVLLILEKSQVHVRLEKNGKKLIVIP
ncbi:FecR family protein [Chitinophaga flava]|nr:FecR family protein [Chitinophaga flava]